MKATELVHFRDTLIRENLPVPFGLILEPESFDELRRDIEEWAKDYCNFATGDPGADPTAPFSFMGFWFDRSDTPNPHAK